MSGHTLPLVQADLVDDLRTPAPGAPVGCFGSRAWARQVASGHPKAHQADAA